MTFLVSKSGQPFLKKLEIDSLDELAEFTSSWEKCAKSKEKDFTPFVKVRFFKRPISKYKLFDLLEIEGPFEGEIRLVTKQEDEKNLWEILPHKIYC